MGEPPARENELRYVEAFVRAMKENVNSFHKRELFLKRMKASLGEGELSPYAIAYGMKLYSADLTFQKIFAVKVLESAEGGDRFKISKGDVWNAYQGALRRAQLLDKDTLRGFAVAFCRFLAKNPAEFLELRNKVLGGP